jgi:hypothetical protein
LAYWRVCRLLAETDGKALQALWFDFSNTTSAQAQPTEIAFDNIAAGDTRAHCEAVADARSQIVLITGLGGR